MPSTTDKYLSLLRNYIPLNSLVKEAFERLKAEVIIDEYKTNQKIFSIGDTDDYSLFLLQGQIELLSKDGKSTVISPQHKQSLYALAALKPRLFNAHACDDVLIARIKTSVLNKLLIWEQSASNNTSSGFEVDDESFSLDDSDAQWKMSMLQTQIFLTLPAANIMTLFDSMETIHVSKGQQIIKQGDPGDYYYMIKEGCCQVSRTFKDDQQAIVLNELASTDCFGEEALVTGESRNASVIMKSDGILVRLSKEQFHSMLEEPILKWIDKQEVKQFIESGAIPIDVRLEDEFAHSEIKNTLNIPLYLLRLKIKNMDKQLKYVLFCDTGARSSAAAFLMTLKGFKQVFILKNGLQS